MRRTPHRILSRDRRRGSVLVVASLFAAGLAIALGSFIALSLQSAKLSNRSFLGNSVLNLAEAGLEEALYALNNSNWTGWSTHSSGSNNRVYTLANVDLGQGTVGSMTVVVYGATTSPAPTIISEGRATPVLGRPVFKQIEVKVQRRSHFATGLVAKDKVTFSGGNATVDSYISDDPNYSTAGLFDASKKRDKGTVASGIVESTSDGVSLGNGDVWGYAATSGSNVDVGPTGSILGADSPTGIKVDPSRVTTDFSANFDLVTAPTSFTLTYADVTGNQTFGSLGSDTTIKLSNYSNTNTKTLTILGNVTLVVTNSVDIKGELVVAANSTLTVYVAGDFTAGGNGIVNTTGLPKDVIIYGTAPTAGGQTIKLHGNAAMHGAVYAPNAHVEMKGGGSSGEMSGSVVAYDIKITGNYAFHYDEALAKIGGGNPFAVGRWRELVTAAERVTL